MLVQFEAQLFKAVSTWLLGQPEFAGRKRGKPMPKKAREEQSKLSDECSNAVQGLQFVILHLCSCSADIRD